MRSTFTPTPGELNLSAVLGILIDMELTNEFNCHRKITKRRT